MLARTPVRSNFFYQLRLGQGLHVDDMGGHLRGQGTGKSAAPAVVREAVTISSGPAAWVWDTLSAGAGAGVGSRYERDCAMRHNWSVSSHSVVVHIVPASPPSPRPSQVCLVTAYMRDSSCCIPVMAGYSMQFSSLITVYSGRNVLRLRYNSSHVHSHKGFTLSKSRNRKSVVQNSRWPIDSLSYNIVSIHAYSTFLKFGRHRNRLIDFQVDSRVQS